MPSGAYGKIPSEIDFIRICATTLRFCYREAGVLLALLIRNIISIATHEILRRVLYVSQV